MPFIDFGLKVIDIIESKGLKANPGILKPIINLQGTYSPDEAATIILADHVNCFEPNIHYKEKNTK